MLSVHYSTDFGWLSDRGLHAGTQRQSSHSRRRLCVHGRVSPSHRCASDESPCACMFLLSERCRSRVPVLYGSGVCVEPQIVIPTPAGPCCPKAAWRAFVVIPRHGHACNSRSCLLVVHSFANRASSLTDAQIHPECIFGAAADPPIVIEGLLLPLDTLPSFPAPADDPLLTEAGESDRRFPSRI